MFPCGLIDKVDDEYQDEKTHQLVHKRFPRLKCWSEDIIE